MTQWDNPIEQLKDKEALKILLWVSFGIWAHEQMSATPFDWRLARGRYRRSWAQVPYWLVKVSWIGLIILAIMSLYHEKRIDCGRMMEANSAMLILLLFSSSLVLARHTALAVGDRMQKMMIALNFGVMALVVIIFWALDMRNVKAVWAVGQGARWQDGACVLTGRGKYEHFQVISAVGFDFSILLLFARSTFRASAGKPRRWLRLAQSGIFYYIALTVVHLLFAIFAIASLNSVVSIIMAIPAAITSWICSTHLFRDHVKQSAPEEEDNVRATYGTSVSFLSDGPAQTATFGSSWKRCKSLASHSFSFGSGSEVESNGAQPSQRQQQQQLQVQLPQKSLQHPAQVASPGIKLVEVKEVHADPPLRDAAVPILLSGDDVDRETTDGQHSPPRTFQ